MVDRTTHTLDRTGKFGSSPRRRATASRVRGGSLCRKLVKWSDDARSPVGPMTEPEAEMLDKRLDSIEKGDIERLVVNGVPEGRALEYKEKLPGGSDGDRKEFLADVSSLANTVGGDIVYGVSEQRDADGKPTGVPARADGMAPANPEADKLRLDSIARDGIAPRITGLRYRWVDGFPNGSVLVVRVPSSWSGPHMVIFQQWSRFYARAANGKYLLDVYQIRDAFARAGDLAARGRRFRNERLAQIIAGETPAALTGDRLIIVHVIPYVAIANEQIVDVRVVPQHQQLMRPFYSDNGHGSFNIDGYLTTVLTGGQRAGGYAQLFRSGILETVDSGMIREDERYGVTLPSTTFAQHLFGFLGRTKTLYTTLEIPAPVSISVALYGVANCRLGLSQHWTFNHGIASQSFGRQMIRLPEMTLEDFDGETQRESRPLLDALWQGAGLERCLEYDDAGRWNRR